MRRLVTVVPAVVVEVAPPKLRDAFAVVARKLLCAVAGPVVADGVLLVAAVGAVVVAVALPGAEDAAASLAALEHVLRAVVLAVGLQRVHQSSLVALGSDLNPNFDKFAHNSVVNLDKFNEVRLKSDFKSDKTNSTNEPIPRRCCRRSC